MKKWKMATVIGLCTASIAGLGFSTWVIGESERVEIPVSADDVVTTTVGLEDVGFEIVPDSFEAFQYVTFEDSSSSVTSEYVGDVFFSVKATIDLDRDHSAFEDVDLRVVFQYQDYASSHNNIVEELMVYPENYDHYDFPAARSETICQENKSDTTQFYFPVESRKAMSLCSLASLDSSYPRNGVYQVPLVFRFTISNVNKDLLESDDMAFPTIKITFGLATSRE